MTLFKTIKTTFSFLKCPNNWQLVTSSDFLRKMNFYHISGTKSGKSEAHTWLDPGEIPNADWWKIHRFVPNLQSDNLSLLVIHQKRKFQKSSSSQENTKKLPQQEAIIWDLENLSVWLSDICHSSQPQHLPSYMLKQILHYKAARTKTTPTRSLQWVTSICT